MVGTCVIKPWICVWVVLCPWAPLSFGWVPILAVYRRTRAAPLCESQSPNDQSGDYLGAGKGDGSNDDNGEDHMAIVRALQDAFYKSPAPTPPCHFELNKAEIFNLPILTWPWHEVPGRSNVLHVHEGSYTNLFETVLRSNPPVWYIGHVYRHGKQTQRKLVPWADVSSFTNDNEDGVGDNDDDKELNLSNKVVIGTLLRISDFRRMADGRLLVLVQALERFCVKNVTQTAPYSVANVQLLPDTDEEGQGRVNKVLQSFEKWHRYEFENTMLPLPLGSSKRNGDSGNDDDHETEEEYLDNSQIVGSALAQVLPFSPYSSVVNVDSLQNERVPQTGISTTVEELEHELLQRKILCNPVLEPDVQRMMPDDLEYALWIAMDRFLKRTKRAVSPVLLGLLPPDQNWPRTFVLEKIVNGILEQQNLDHKCVRVSSHYPASRRQKRLSYAAASLLEDDEYQAQAIRLKVLQIPSTKQRLAFVLQKLRDKLEGSFQ